MYSTATYNLSPRKGCNSNNYVSRVYQYMENRDIDIKDVAYYRSRWDYDAILEKAKITPKQGPASEKSILAFSRIAS